MRPILHRLDPYRLLLPRRGEMKVDALVYAGESLLIEEEALVQLESAASVPGVVRALATPDIHVGFGVPIGCVLASRSHLVPAAVGYDINCGMRLLRTPFEAREFPLEAVARALGRSVPLGEGKRNLKVSLGALEEVLARGVPGLRAVAEELGEAFPGWDPQEMERDLPFLEDRGSLPGDPGAVSPAAKERGRFQLGTLGGGNHFLEFQEVEKVLDAEGARRLGIEEGKLTLMIHSGSRGLGHQVASDYMRLAGAGKGKRAAGPGGLAALEAESGRGARYLGAMNAAANFAYANRHVLACLARREIRLHADPSAELPLVYDVTHNILKKETHGGEILYVHRKGATRAFPAGLMKGTPYEDIGQPVTIPGSMGTGSYLLLPGPKAEESLYSVNHGAGRVLSRSAASGRDRRGRVKGTAAVSDEEFRRSMEGILLICEDRRTIKEEAPAAYKDIDEVIRVVAGAGLAKPVARMRPLAVLKG